MSGAGLADMYLGACANAPDGPARLSAVLARALNRLAAEGHVVGARVEVTPSLVRSIRISLAREGISVWPDEKDEPGAFEELTRTIWHDLVEGPVGRWAVLDLDLLEAVDDGEFDGPEAGAIWDQALAEAYFDGEAFSVPPYQDTEALRIWAEHQEARGAEGAALAAYDHIAEAGNPALAAEALISRARIHARRAEKAEAVQDPRAALTALRRARSCAALDTCPELLLSLMDLGLVEEMRRLFDECLDLIRSCVRRCAPRTRSGEHRRCLDALSAGCRSAFNAMLFLLDDLERRGSVGTSKLGMMKERLSAIRPRVVAALRTGPASEGA